MTHGSTGGGQTELLPDMGNRLSLLVGRRGVEHAVHFLQRLPLCLWDEEVCIVNADQGAAQQPRSLTDSQESKNGKRGEEVVGSAVGQIGKHHRRYEADDTVKSAKRSTLRVPLDPQVAHPGARCSDRDTG